MRNLCALIICALGICATTNGREEVLDPNGYYLVKWQVDFSNQIVTFDLTVRTTGYVGFGISHGAGMLGADIVIGGIWANGTTYFEDCHGLGTFRPEVDTIQNYNLLALSENVTHTHLRFSRLFDTKDPQDAEITTTPTNFIWSFGPTDRILYHGPNRGDFPVNILHIPFSDS